ncbi:hypothetical protein NXC24_PC01936 (plasmid) [Rhizobium sp. NXC24]|nr:hypothetical protein NXC24_PC01936 [Rhizobium sp. NXC24]
MSSRHHGHIPRLSGYCRGSHRPMRTDGFDVAAVHEVTAAFEKSVHLGRAPLAITGSAGVASPSLRQAAAIGNVYR